MKIFARIRFFWGATVIILILSFFMIPFTYLFAKRKGCIIHWANRAMTFLMGVRTRIIGERDKRANLFLMNHQGIMDIIAMEAAERNHMCWVAKKELFDTPWFGYVLKNGDMISTDRQNKAGLLRLLHDVQDSITRKGRTVIIFPEGTRTDKQKLLPFKSGPKLIAEKLAMRVQPIVITNSKKALNEHNHTGHSTTITITYLPAFDVAEAPKEWYEDLRETMQKAIDKEHAVHGRER